MLDEPQLDDEADATAADDAPPAPVELLVESAAMPRADWARLRSLPWGVALQEWPDHGVTPLSVRRGESRHPVLFVEAGQRRYALKETSPRSAAHESMVFQELRRRRCHTLEPVGYVVVRGEAIAAGDVAGHTMYTSGDVGYCVTRLADRVLPQSLLYRYPFTDANKRLLWSAVAELLLDLHEAGVYWGDPSLANILMDLSGHRLTAVMADAETAELVPGPLTENRRREDLNMFVELLEWQAEDIRLARSLPEEQRLISASDAAYFMARYAGLRAEREQSSRAAEDLFARVLDLQNQMQRLCHQTRLAGMPRRSARGGTYGVCATCSVSASRELTRAPCTSTSSCISGCSASKPARTSASRRPRATGSRDTTSPRSRSWPRTFPVRT
jgi:hypothetical protein